MSKVFVSAHKVFINARFGHLTDTDTWLQKANEIKISVWRGSPWLNGQMCKMNQPKGSSNGNGSKAI